MSTTNELYPNTKDLRKVVALHRRASTLRAEAELMRVNVRGANDRRQEAKILEGLACDILARREQ
jgi:hypothetical protein